MSQKRKTILKSTGTVLTMGLHSIAFVLICIIVSISLFKCKYKCSVTYFKTVITGTVANYAVDMLFLIRDWILMNCGACNWIVIT